MPNPGSWQAIWEAESIPILVDEVLHSIEYLPFPEWLERVWAWKNWRIRYCDWAHDFPKMGWPHKYVDFQAISDAILGGMDYDRE